MEHSRLRKEIFSQIGRRNKNFSGTGAHFWRLLTGLLPKQYIIFLIIFFFPLMLLGANGSTSSLLGLFKLGGIWMWILLLLSILALGFIIEKIYSFHKAKLQSKSFFTQFDRVLKQNDFARIEDFFEKSGHLISKVINNAFKRNIKVAEFENMVERQSTIEIKELGRGLTLLATIGSVAPLVGFLGTVAGMIRAFGNIAAADEVSAQLVAGGIYTALTTTAYGLIIAIPSIAMYNFFINRIDNFTADIEKTVNLILNKKLIK